MPIKKCEKCLCNYSEIYGHECDGLMKTLVENKEEKIKEVQKKAKEIGHCLCNLVLKCPCPAFTNNGICKCSEK